jgi:hypothetical protein
MVTNYRGSYLAPGRYANETRAIHNELRPIKLRVREKGTVEPGNIPNLTRASELFTQLIWKNTLHPRVPQNERAPLQYLRENKNHMEILKKLAQFKQNYPNGKVLTASNIPRLQETLKLFPKIRYFKATNNVNRNEMRVKQMIKNAKKKEIIRKIKAMPEVKAVRLKKEANRFNDIARRASNSALEISDADWGFYILYAKKHGMNNIASSLARNIFKIPEKERKVLVIFTKLPRPGIASDKILQIAKKHMNVMIRLYPTVEYLNTFRRNFNKIMAVPQPVRLKIEYLTSRGISIDKISNRDLRNIKKYKNYPSLRPATINHVDREIRRRIRMAVVNNARRRTHTWSTQQIQRNISNLQGLVARNPTGSTAVQAALEGQAATRPFNRSRTMINVGNYRLPVQNVPLNLSQPNFNQVFSMKRLNTNNVQETIRILKAFYNTLPNTRNKPNAPPTKPVRPTTLTIEKKRNYNKAHKNYESNMRTWISEMRKIWKRSNPTV